MAFKKNRIVRWSLSAMKQFYKCKAQYKYQRFDRLPTPPSPALERGIAVHNKFEQFLKDEIQGVPPELESHYTELRALKRLGFVAEDNWALSRELEPADWDPNGYSDWDNIWLMAKTDAHLYDEEEQHVDIIDIKTGRIYPDHVEGAEVYSMVAAQYYPDAETFSSEFFYVDQGMGEIGKSPFEFTRDEVINEITPKWKRKAHRMIMCKAFDPEPSKFGCRFCDFRSDKTLADGVTKGPCNEWKTVL